MSWLEIDYFKDSSKLPVVSCCYAIYLDGSLKYIGSTNNLRNRFSGRFIRYGYAKDILTPWGRFPDSTTFTVKYKPSRKYGDWMMIEARLIRRLQPVFNTKLKGRKSNALLPA